MIENINPSGYKKIGVYTPAKKIDCGNYYLIYVSGIQAHASKENNSRVDSDDIEVQTHEVFSDIGDILKSAGASFDDVIKAVIYLTDMSEFEKVSKIRAEYFKNSMPVSTLVEVNRMVRDGAKIEIEVTALLKKQYKENLKMKNYELWLNKFMESWKNLEGIKTTELFSKDVKYYETPMGKPCKTWEEVEDLWRVVNYNQKVQSYSFKILCETKDFAIVNWQMERTMNGNSQKIDGIFQISLNDENKLTYFKQWRAVLSEF